MEAFTRLNYQVLMTLYATIDNAAKAHISGLADAVQAFEKLKSLYERTGRDGLFLLWQKIRGIKYNPNGNHNAFLQKWQAAITEIRTLGDLPDWIEYCLFLQSIEGVPHLDNFIMNMEMTTAGQQIALADVYAQFQHFEFKRHATGMARTQSNTNQLSANSVRGGRGGQRGGRGSNQSNTSQSNSNSNSTSNQTNQRPSDGPATKDPNNEDAGVIWCHHHGKFGSHLPSECRLKNATSNPSTTTSSRRGGQRGRGRGRGGFTANATSHSDQDNENHDKEANQIAFDSDSLFANNIELSCQQIRYEEVSAVNRDRPHDWMLDSGASDTMTPYRSSFVDYHEMVLPVRTATGQVFWTKGYGTVIVDLTPPNSTERIGSIILPKVWHAPALAHNLISIRKLAELGIDTVFRKNGGVELIHNGLIKAFAETIQNHYFLCTTGRESIKTFKRLQQAGGLSGSEDIEHVSCPGYEAFINATTIKEPQPISIELAHRRTAHLSERRLRMLPDYVTGLRLKKGGLRLPCGPCVIGKGHQLPYGRDKSIRSGPGEFLHIDVCGPLSVQAHGGETYFLTVTDDATQFCWVFLLKSRTEVLDKLIQVINYLETQFSYRVKRIRGDNAAEHEPIQSYATDKGIAWDLTPPYTPQLNGVAEIKNRHLIEPVISVMAENQLPKYLWGHLVLAVNYLSNRLFHSKIGMTPYEALYGVQPDVSH
jgi:transposase InsO family protein